MGAWQSAPDLWKSSLIQSGTATLFSGCGLCLWLPNSTFTLKKGLKKNSRVLGAHCVHYIHCETHWGNVIVIWGYINTSELNTMFRQFNKHRYIWFEMIENRWKQGNLTLGHFFLEMDVSITANQGWSQQTPVSECPLKTDARCSWVICPLWKR